MRIIEYKYSDDPPDSSWYRQGLYSSPKAVYRFFDATVRRDNYYMRHMVWRVRNA
jgi:hypothetical protein